jgi:hypothetical protein
VSCVPFAHNAHYSKSTAPWANDHSGSSPRTISPTSPAAEAADLRRLSGHMEAPHTPATLNLLSAAALFKPQAVENLAVNLSSYNIDVSIVTEIHFILKHSGSAVAIDGYTIFRQTVRDLPTFEEQCDNMDQNLFSNIYLQTRTICYIKSLPPPSTASQIYNLRPQPHSQELPQHSEGLTRLIDSNLITRILYKNTY